jgi:DNA-binding transcriptional regulator YiaG
MATQPKLPSRILEAVHETAEDLYKLGLIDSNRMQSYDTRCLTAEQASQLATHRDMIRAGATSDPGVDAEEAFARLEHKYGL